MANNNKIEWTKFLTSKLIELWEERPCLYDPKNKFYSNKHARINALEEIAGQLSEGEMEVSADEVKKKIYNIRSQFNHELTKMKDTHTGMGADDLYEPSVWWFQKVEFLKRFIKTRKSKSNFEPSQDSENITEMAIADEDYDDDTQPQHVSHSENVESSSSSVAEPLLVETPSRAPSAKKFKKVIGSDTDEVMDQTLKTLQKINASHEKIIAQASRSANAEFAKFISKELDSIDNVELLDELKFEIHKLLFTYKKRYTELVKSGVVIEQL